MPYDSYAAKGLFADLYQLMDQDESFVRDNYLTNVMEALSTNGKLYRMCTSFYVTTLAGAASRVGNEPGWTMQEMMQALNAAEGATLFANQTRETLQYQILSPMISQFIDSDTGRCSFDSQEFIDLITYIASAPESSSNGAVGYSEYSMGVRETMAMASNVGYYNGESEYVSEETLLRTGKALLTNLYLSESRDLVYLKWRLNDTPTLIGYPTTEGNGGYIVPNTQLAISASSANLNACWDFMKFMLSEERQTRDDNYNFPMLRSAFEAYLDEGMHGYTWTDVDGVEHVEPITFWDESTGEPKEVDPLTRQEVDALNAYICSITRIQSYDNSLYEIITEELTNFFAGKKDAKTTVDVIQNRAQTYINETR